MKTKSIRKTAKFWGTSRLVVRKWARRYQKKGEESLEGASRRSRRSSGRTALPIEEKVLKMRKEKGYGRRRIAWFLLRENNIEISENTITHILKRAGLGRNKKQRKAFYPAKGAYNEDTLFKLA